MANSRRKISLAIFATVSVFGFCLGIQVFKPKADPASMLRAAIRNEDRRNPEAFVAELDRILDLYPDHPGTLLERESHSSSAKESIGYLTRITKGTPIQLANVRLREGNLFLELNRAREAEVALRAAVLQLPGFEAAPQRLIPLVALQRRPEAVREQLQILRSSRKLSLPELALWITADGRLTPFDEAISRLELFSENDSNDQASVLGLCIYLEEEGRAEQAIGRLKQWLGTARADSEATSLLARFLLNSGRINEAQELLRNFAVTEDSSDLQWETLGQYCLSTGNLERGIVASEFAALQAPFKRSAAYQFYRALTAVGRNHEAESWLVRTDVLNSLHAEVEKVGISILRSGRDFKSIQRVAELLLQLDRPQDAIEWVEIAKSMGSPESVNSEVEQMCRERLKLYRPLHTTPPVEAWNLSQPEALTSGGVHEDSSVPIPAAGIRLADRAREYGLVMNYENGHTGFKYLVETMGGGVGVLDLDKDGWPDLYCPQGGSLGDGPLLPQISDQLFRNRRGITFSNVSVVAGIVEYGYSQGLAIGDINLDGFDDIVVANVGRNKLFLSCGDGTFLDATLNSGLEASTAMSSSMALADLDIDGDLDLYVVNYVTELMICRDDEGKIATCNPASHKAAPDELYENLGDGTFRDISQTIRDDKAPGKGLGIVIALLDDDVQPDIFVSNDTTPNSLLLNQSTANLLQFEEMGFPMGVAVNASGQTCAGMGIACADLDHDLRQDLYVTNFHREANSLFLQQHAAFFNDDTAAAGLREPTLPLLGFGTQAVDLDLDGWMELFVTNGDIDDQRHLGMEWQMAPQLFRTTDGQRWSDISMQSGDFMVQKALGRGVALLDADRDGRQDIVVGYQDRPMALVINETKSAGNFVTLSLTGVLCNRSAINTLVFWEIGGKRMMTELRGGDGYYCSNERRLTLGLEKSSVVDLIEIHWPDGEVDEFRNVIGNKSYQALQNRLLVEDPL